MLTPRDTEDQRCRNFHLDITPNPEIIEEYIDFFGNKIIYFIIEEEHERLVVTTISEIEKNWSDWKLKSISTDGWEIVRDQFRHSIGNLMDEKQYIIPSEITAPSAEIIDYAEQSFIPGRPLFESISDLMSRIYTDFKYSSGFTTISTPLSEVIKERKGVCQDFAHLGIACIQAMGLPAKYVSGYLETTSPLGKEKIKRCRCISCLVFGIYSRDGLDRF
jgi:transglutaminase-like putative cysteine protease